MGVNTVNNTNQADIIKLALLAKQGKTSTTSSSTPTWMTSNGSIFNAPGVAATSTSNGSIQDLNTQQTLMNLLNTTTPSENNSNADGNTTFSNDEILNIDNASDGKKATRQVEAQKNNVEQLTTQTENNTKEMKQVGTYATKLTKEIDKDTKAFEKQMKLENKALEKNQESIQKEIQSMDDTQTEVDALQQEIDSILGGDNTGVGKTSAFSLSIGNEVNEPDQGQPMERSDLERVGLLQEQLNAKIQLMSGTQQKIYTLQQTSTKTINTMTNLSNQQVTINKANQADVTENQTRAQEVIKFADDVEQISGIVATAGTTLNYAGQGLIALGMSTSWAGVGAALIATGQVMSKMGVITETIGQYGQTAAGITKTAAYAAEGNLAGALTSAASAITAGTSAAKSTKNMSKTFDEINKKANEASQKLAQNISNNEKVAEKVKDVTSESTKQVTQDGTKEIAKESSKQVSDKTKSNTFENLEKVGNTLLAAGSKLQQLQQGNQNQNNSGVTKPVIDKHDYQGTAEMLAKINRQRYGMMNYYAMRA